MALIKHLACTNIKAFLLEYCDPTFFKDQFTESKQLLVPSVRFSPAVVEVLEKDTPAIFGPDSAAKRNEAFIQEAKGGSLLACFVGKCFKWVLRTCIL